MGKSHSKYLKSSTPPNHQPKAGPSSWKNEIHHSQQATNQECPIQKGHKGSKHDETIMENDDMSKSVTFSRADFISPTAPCDGSFQKYVATCHPQRAMVPRVQPLHLTTVVCPRKNSLCTLEDMSISHCFAPWRNTDQKRTGCCQQKPGNATPTFCNSQILQDSMVTMDHKTSNSLLRGQSGRRYITHVAAEGTANESAIARQLAKLLVHPQGMNTLSKKWWQSKVLRYVLPWFGYLMLFVVSETFWNHYQFWCVLGVFFLTARCPSLGALEMLWLLCSSRPLEQVSLNSPLPLYAAEKDDAASHDHEKAHPVDRWSTKGAHPRRELQEQNALCNHVAAICSVPVKISQLCRYTMLYHDPTDLGSNSSQWNSPYVQLFYSSW